MLIAKYRCGNCGLFEIGLLDGVKPFHNVVCAKCTSVAKLVKVNRV